MEPWTLLGWAVISILGSVTLVSLLNGIVDIMEGHYGFLLPAIGIIATLWLFIGAWAGILAILSIIVAGYIASRFQDHNRTTNARASE